MDLFAFAQGFKEEVFRLVESQEKAATMALVDSLEEQFRLEELIEQTKPIIEENKQRHYLIQTPFRYPPLKHGSRFGSRFQPAIFYAGKNLPSALCESAYYSFYFISRMMVPYKKPILNHKTSFRVQIEDTQHIDLCQVAEKQFQSKLTHKSNYQFSQSIGQKMREGGVASFSYYSARCCEAINIGVFDINAIIGEPNNFTHWETKQTATDLLFYCAMQPSLSMAFKIDDFLVDGKLPRPSA